MESIQKTKGGRGGLAVIISPDNEFTELYQSAIGVDFNDLKGPPLKPEDIENVNLFNSERPLPIGDIDVTQRLIADTTALTNTASESTTLN